MSQRWPSRRSRHAERRESNFRAAWNRVGKAFGLRKEELDLAKSSQLTPHRILRNSESYTTESVRYYIESGGTLPRKHDSVADCLVDREIDRLTEMARLEQEGLSVDEILDRVGEQWW